MAWFAVGSAVVGGVGSILAGNAQADAMNKATNIQQQTLDFNRERYQDFKDVYGNLQEDTAEYFENLTGESISNKEKIAYQEAGQASIDKVRETLAQRGIDGSGLEGQLTSNIIYDTEIKKATSEATSEATAQAQKLNFLNIGLQQEAKIANSIQQGTNNLANSAIAQGNNSATTIGNVTGFATNVLTAIDKDTNTEKPPVTKVT